MSAEISIPEASVVQAALRTTTERLAQELGQPTDVSPTWSEFEWRAARAAAAIHGVSPLLATSLRWRGPPEWQAFLADQRAHTENRHQRIDALAKRIDQLAREAGIPMVALKGAALHQLGLYRAGERPMADLDLLVEEADMAPATKLLEAQSFHTHLTYWKNRIFEPGGESVGGLGEHRDNKVKVELHWRIRERLPLELTDVSDVIFPSNFQPGFNPYPSRAALLTHLALHAAGGIVSRELRLLHLHDLALVSRSLQEQDWEEILRKGESGTWWFLPPLQLTSRYYPDVVPSPVLSKLKRSCPARLNRVTTRQSLTDVSLSSVWIRAFPGIQWSRSASESFRYMLARVRPDSEARAIRTADTATARWASDSRWQSLSQRSRIVRWMTSRPTRTATMYVVREALR
jgi:hypothetical protein